ncbi:MAG TPA: FliI/YscN family ATPase [Candidatus Brocadiia bacterium]|nr:FliI/YscN family ATPase [Candidatus Brocadiia bacterium]
MTLALDVEPMIRRVRQATLGRWSGRVTDVIGLTIASRGPVARVGEYCVIHRQSGGALPAEVVGFRDGETLLMPLGDGSGLAPGDVVEAQRRSFQVRIGEGLLGRALDGLGRPMDGLGELTNFEMRPVDAPALKPLERAPITQPLATGIRAIDTLLTIGKGQRMGIFAGSGVGKSVLMSEIVKNTRADITVVGLIGERGREVKEFIEKALGDEGRRRAVVVAATSDQPALVRVKGAYVATTIAEYFRSKGRDVLLLMDSVTRFCNAQREVGLAIGEPPATKGFTPSVFALLPQLLERCGCAPKGSVTGLFTVLVDGDDLSEPVPDAVRGILDGHIVLSRKIASRGHYPAIDIHPSVSRLMTDIVTPQHRQAARRLKAIDFRFREAEDMIRIGAYVKGSDPAIDEAIARHDEIEAFLRQDIGEKADFDASVQRLVASMAQEPKK